MKRMFVILSIVLLAGCHSIPTTIDTSKTDELAIDVMAGQTEIASTAKDVQSSIETVKVITDESKVTGEIPKEKIPLVIKAIDNSSELISILNEQIKNQSNKIAESEKSRINDNKKHSDIIVKFSEQIDALKRKASFRGKVVIILSSTLAIISICGIIYIVIKIKT